MDKELTVSIMRSNHYLKTGSFFLCSLVAFLALVPDLGPYRFIFLGALIFIPLLIIELVSFRKDVDEIKKKNITKATMEIGRLSLMYMKGKMIGILFEGLVDGKAEAIKYYTMEKNTENTMNNLARYKYVYVEYYKRTGIVMEFHAVSGDKNVKGRN